MAGRKGRSGGGLAKTVEEHRLEGTYRATRHKDIVNPKPPKGLPVKPNTLAGAASDEWDRMIVRLSLSKTISLVDDGVIYQHVLLFAETEQLVIEKAEARAAVERLLESQGDVEKSDLLPFFQEVGKMMKLSAGYDSKLRSNRVALIHALAEFGLTPVSRGRVKVASADEGALDPFAQFDVPHADAH
jgi:hypothetical protein